MHFTMPSPMQRRLFQVYKRHYGQALKLIPKKLSQQPVFLCINDTMVSKFGKKFENVSKLFDHAAHNSSNYLNGHCFISVMLCVPVWDKNRIHYLSVPLGYRM